MAKIEADLLINFNLMFTMLNYIEADYNIKADYKLRPCKVHLQIEAD